MEDCTQQEQAFLDANELALAAYTSEDNAADQVAQAAAAVTAAEAALAQAQQDQVDAEAAHQQATTVADAAEADAASAYQTWMQCERGTEDVIVPTLYAKKRNRAAKIVALLLAASIGALIAAQPQVADAQQQINVTVNNYQSWADREASMQARRGRMGHIQRPLPGTKAGVGWSTRGPQDAVRQCCYWRGRHRARYFAVSRGPRGWYAAAIYIR